jgi:hypothetical protein
MSRNIRWNLTSQTPEIFGIDARAFIPAILVLFHIRLWTLGLTVISVAIFGFLAMRGLPLPVLYRKIKHRLAGKTRAARPWWFWRRFRVAWWHLRYRVN